MKIDELEELLEQDDIYALFWVNHHIKKKGRAEFLLGLENDYVQARGSHDETGSIEGTERHFAEGMQYLYCESGKGQKPRTVGVSECFAQRLTGYANQRHGSASPER